MAADGGGTATRLAAESPWAFRRGAPKRRRAFLRLLRSLLNSAIFSSSSSTSAAVSACLAAA